ncbi:MAG: LptA/OstA family protein [Verrucomicrobiales bacterium]|nr:LptA/OstA family protein [Verrucomicrobiales bacterium]
MKIPLHITGALFLSLASMSLNAQDKDAAIEKAKKEGQSLIDNPSMQNLFRQAKKDPAEAAKSLQADPGDIVRDATRMFQEKKNSVDLEGIDTPENRAKAERIKSAAMSKVGELTGAAKPESTADVPATGVPATRSSAGATRFVTPIAMPVEETPTPLAADANGATVVQDKEVQPMASVEPTLPQIPDTPSLTGSDIPAPKPLSPKYNTKAGGGYQGADKDHMEIKARESVMDNNKGLLTFQGNVIVDHPEFEMKCETLEIYMAEGMGAGAKSDGSDPFKRAIASGGMVEIRRLSPDGKTQIAMARRADYNAVTKDIILSGGPPYIQDGDKFIETSSADAKIIMRGTGQYQITGSDAGPKNRTRIVIPVSGGDKSKDIGIQGLGGGIDRLR